MTIRQVLRILLGPALIPLLLGTSSAVTVDNFSVSALGGSVSLGDVTTTDFTGLPGVLGGTRKANILFTGDSNSAPFTANVSFGVDGVPDPDSDTLHFEATGGPLATGTVLMVIDGSGTGAISVGDPLTGIDFDGLGSIDLTDGGTQGGFLFDVESVNGPVDFTVTIYDSSLNDGTRTSHSFSVGSAGLLVVPFSNFNSAILSDAGAVALTIDLPIHESNVRLETWETAAVPEPGALSLFALGLAVFLSFLHSRPHKK